jgi:hypothetical protein
MKHKLHLTGVEVDLSIPVADILAVLQKSLDRFYPDSLVKATDYEELDERTAKFTLIRDLPFDYCSALSGCLGYIDASILSGMPESEFVFDPTSKNAPIIKTLIPWGRCWYVPTAAFVSLMKQLNETMLGEKISRMKIHVDTDKIEIQVKFSRDKGKYDDDIADLESEIGPLEGHRGETLTFTLKRLGEDCERTYLKAKSYQGLKSYLKKAYKIELEIK